MTDITGEAFAAQQERFVTELNAGGSMEAAIKATNDMEFRPLVVEAATAMLAATGSIDMKQLARDAGMSRASLYRCYPDKVKVIAEIGAVGIETLADVAAVHDNTSDKFRAAANYLVDHPGETAAMMSLAANVGMDVIAAAGERIAGDPAIVPILLGLAVMAATPCRPDSDVEAINRYIDHTAQLFS